MTGSQRWEPKNYDGKFEGPMRMRTALAKSKNMVSIRILQSIDPKYAQDYVTRFGFDADKHPPVPDHGARRRLGDAACRWRAPTPCSPTAAISIQPYFIDKIVDDRGNPLGAANPPHAGDESLRVIDARNAFIMDSMMQDVTRYGTAASVAKLGRHDLAGKTGTTNDFVDGWFCGYHPELVGIAWMGFDQPKTLGRNQTGGRVALPIWIEYMGKILKGLPEAVRSVPEGVISVRTDPDSAASPEARGGSEYFYREFAPVKEEARGILSDGIAGRNDRRATGAAQRHRPSRLLRNELRDRREEFCCRRACRATPSHRGENENRRTSPPPRSRALRHAG